MQETIVRDALLAYSANEPPMTFTSTDVVRRYRRARLFRIASGVGVAAVVAGVVALVLPQLVPAPHQVAQPPPAPPVLVGPAWAKLYPDPYCAIARETASPRFAPTSVVSPKDGLSIPIPTEPVFHAGARLSCYLMRAVPDRMPGMLIYQDYSAYAMPLGTLPFQAYPAREFDPARPQESSPPYFAAWALVSDDRGAGSVGFNVIASAPEAGVNAAERCVAQCVVRTGPRDEVITVDTFTDDSGWQSVQVNVYSGQTQVFALASNELPVSGAPVAVSGHGRVARPEPPLTVEQLIEIATAPELTLFP